MSTPSTFQILAGIMGRANASGGGGGGSGPVDLPGFNTFGGLNTSNTVNLEETAFRPEGDIVDPWSAVSIFIKSDGTGRYTRSNVNVGDQDTNFTWLNTGSNSDYFTFATNFSGDALAITSDAMDTPRPLTSNTFFQLYVEAVGSPTAGPESKTCSFDLQIREASSNTVVDEVYVEMYVWASKGLAL